VIQNLFFTGALLIAGLGIHARERPSLRADPYSGGAMPRPPSRLTDTLFAVASDEDSVIRVYHRDQAGEPVQSIICLLFSTWTPEAGSDLEGAARVGRPGVLDNLDGRNKNGKERRSRDAFFAVQS